ncbi:hypothetical protein EK21DRAFT_105340 [Setomelanomma holmii]|uniref:Kinesin light chain n=1 Tax=Setomelanomma holmii TaxID=210430 RepID=A0A9P4GWS1_9PLEO|nr:hypothetical protein EK21DRAFT_105340 [Setomelanomma holmii]
MKVQKKVLGQEHQDTLSSMAMNDAEKLEVQVIETCKKKLGADYLDTLTSIANLASTYRNQGRWDAAEELEVQNQGRWDAAEELEVQVMETCKKKLGADHPDTLASMNNLAHTQKSLGQVIDAIQLMRECVQLCQQRFRPNHPNLLSSLATLAQWEVIEP